MASIEQIELDHHRKAMTADMQHLVEKYRAIFDWDVPDINQTQADHLIIAALVTALDEIKKSLTV